MGKTRLWCGLLLSTALTIPLRAQEAEPAPEGEPAKPHLEWGLEAKANFRRSEPNSFAVPFPFSPSMLPVGQTRGFEETVNAGSHIELSDATIYLDGIWSDDLRAHLKVDFISLYERNPTSTGVSTNVDEAWIRLGREAGHALLAPRSGVYAKIGKFPKFERQNDRRLESYGLVSTAFNRIEDVGLELGADIGPHVYVKGSLTTGNPVFMRDPNALAVLSMMLTLAPGTAWGELALDGSVLLVHVFDLDDEAAFITQFKRDYEQPLKEIFES